MDENRQEYVLYDRREKQYVIPAFVVGSAVNPMLNGKLVWKCPKLIGGSRERMSYLPLGPISRMVSHGGADAASRQPLCKRAYIRGGVRVHKSALPLSHSLARRRVV